MSVVRWNAITKADVERFDSWRVHRSYIELESGAVQVLDIASPGVAHTRALAADVRRIWTEDESAERYHHPLDFTGWADDDWFDFGPVEPIPPVYTQYEEDEEGFLVVAHASTWAPPDHPYRGEIDSSDVWAISPGTRLAVGFDSSDRGDDT